MTMFNKRDFINFILENSIVGFKDPPYPLNSGRKSSWYANWRNISEKKSSLDRLANYIINFTEDLGLKPDCFYGVPEGATKLGIVTQYKWDEGSDILPMGRGKPKDHGDPKDRYFICPPSGWVVVLEDVTTTGLSLLEEVVKIKETNKAKIIAALTLTDRLESTPSPSDWHLKEGVYMRFVDAFEKITGKFNSYDGNMSVQQAFKKLGIPFYALSDARELLPEAFRRFKPNDKILSELKKQLDNPFVSLVSYSELIGQDDLIKDERIYKPTVFGSS